jgi:hypothetical protein
MMKTNLNKITAVWVFVAGLVLASAATMLKDTTPKAPETMVELRKYLNEKASPRNRIIEITEDLGILIITTSSLVGGIRRIRRRHWLNGILLVIPGVAICVLNISMTHINYQVAELTAEDMPYPNLEKIKTVAANNKLSPKQRSIIYADYGRYTFLKDGTIVDVVNENGEIKPYSPAKKDRQSRELQQVGKEVWSTIREALPYKYAYWITILISSCLAGAFIPISASTQQRYRR